MILSKSSPPAQSLQACVLLLKYHLLCDQVDICLIFEVLVELDYMRVILYKARLVVGMAFVLTWSKCVYNLQASEES